MSFVTCPCGFRADGLAREALRAYRMHSCSQHEAEEFEDVADDGGGTSWAGVAALVVVLLFLSFICTHGWGRFS